MRTSSKELLMISAAEGVGVEELSRGVARGLVVVPQNPRHRNLQPLGIGQGLRIKVNANIGTSPDRPSLETELEKLKAALEAGADSIMDLSTGGDLDEIRRAILERCPVPLGTVPIYQAVVETVRARKSMVKMTADHLFRVIERQARDGVDFVTVHCGVTLGSVERLRRQKRITDVVSRGGAFTVEWMYANRKENPLYAEYDTLLAIARKYDLVLSLGDGLRPGSLADATDRAQVQELLILGELVDRARAEGVQVMVEGPGHVPLHQIQANVVLQKEICKGAPFYVLGPLVTDVAPGYDHITAAIGGAVAGQAGADFLCYVTPSEHLRLPTVDDVREGVVALRIAAHAADIARGGERASSWDLSMSKARKSLDWRRMIELSLDPARTRALHDSDPSHRADVCTMCGDYCAMKRIRDVFLEDRRGNRGRVKRLPDRRRKSGGTAGRPR